MQRVVIDCRFAGTPTGLGRYTRELVTSLLTRNDGIAYVLLAQSAREEWLTQLRGHLSFEVVEAAIPHYSLSEQIRLPRMLRSLNAQLFFVPHFNVPLLCPLPAVCTVHDLILHRYPNEAPWWKRLAYRLVMGRAVRRSRALIAVSEFTKSELSVVYGSSITPKIRVIREGAGPLFCPRPETEVQRVRKAYHLNRPFFLYVGNAKQHKNVQFLIDARARAYDTPADLVLITNGPEVDRLRLNPSVKIFRRIDDAELAVLYTMALAFVTASLYEGFCLPMLEAEACGCPVIATNVTAIPEAAKRRTMLLPPTIEAFQEAFLHPPVRSPARKSVGWYDAAEETAKVLREALDRPARAVRAVPAAA